MAEELQESKIEEIITPAIVQTPPSNWIRAVLVVEYLIALQVSMSVWAQVGGQGHLDLMPWYTKLTCVALAALCVVRFTAAILTGPSFWTRKTRIWFAGVLLLGAIMGGITYYYHLHEVSDEPEGDDTSAKSVRNDFAVTMVQQA